MASCDRPRHDECDRKSWDGRDEGRHGRHEWEEAPPTVTYGLNQRPSREGEITLFLRTCALFSSGSRVVVGLVVWEQESFLRRCAGFLGELEYFELGWNPSDALSDAPVFGELSSDGVRLFRARRYVPGRLFGCASVRRVILGPYLQLVFR